MLTEVAKVVTDASSLLDLAPGPDPERLACCHAATVSGCSGHVTGEGRTVAHGHRMAASDGR
jgi:hypothetical protein